MQMTRSIRFRMAVALGVSQLSETGKWVYKVQGTSDSRGQFGASVGAGMHW